MTEPLLWRFKKHAVGFLQNGGNSVCETDCASEPDGVWTRRTLAAFLPGKPMVGLAEQVVAHLAPADEVEGFRVGPQAQDFRDVDLAGHSS